MNWTEDDEQRGNQISYLSLEEYKEPNTGDYLVAQGGMRLDILHKYGVHIKIMNKEITSYDILIACTYLACFNDILCRLLKYFETMGNIAIRYRRKAKFGFSIQCDSAHNAPKDSKEQGGFIMDLGLEPIHVRSMKLKAVTIDLTESEGTMMCGSAKICCMDKKTVIFLRPK